MGRRGGGEGRAERRGEGKRRGGEGERRGEESGGREERGSEGEVREGEGRERKVLLSKMLHGTIKHILHRRKF